MFYGSLFILLQNTFAISRSRLFNELTNGYPSITLTWMFQLMLNTWGPRKNYRYFPDDILKCFYLNENVWISITTSLKFVRKGLINNIPALVQIMAWRRPGDKPLSEPVLVSLLTHLCATRPQWVNVRGPSYLGLSGSISWLLMPWILATPGYQQPIYLLCKISKSWSYTRKDFNYLWHINVEEWHKM